MKDRIYFLEIDKKSTEKLKDDLKREGISYIEGKAVNKRSLVWIIENNDF